MRLSFNDGFGIKKIQREEHLREFRNLLGGSEGLTKQNNKLIRKEISQEVNFYNKNNQEILDKKTVSELETELSDKNSLAKVWWDIGDNANIGMSDEKTDEILVQSSRTNDQDFGNRLAPTPSTVEDAKNLKSIKQQLMDARDAKRKR